MFISTYLYLGFLGLLLFCWLWVATSKESADRFDKRNPQNLMRQRLEQLIESHSKEIKLSKLETLYLQAGVKFSLVSHYLMCILSTIVVTFLIYIFFQNEIIVCISLVLSPFLPYEILTILKNRRAEKIADQGISFMQMFGKRYEFCKNIPEAFTVTADKLKHMQPIGGILQECVLLLQAGYSLEEMLNLFTIKCNNKKVTAYIYSLINAQGINSIEARRTVLAKAEERAIRTRELKREQANKLNGNKLVCYLMMAAVPAMYIYRASSEPEYAQFMLHSIPGKITVACVFLTVLGVFYIMNKYILTFKD